MQIIWDLLEQSPEPPDEDPAALPYRKQPHAGMAQVPHADKDGGLKTAPSLGLKIATTLKASGKGFNTEPALYSGGGEEDEQKRDFVHMLVGGRSRASMGGGLKDRANVSGSPGVHSSTGHLVAVLRKAQSGSEHGGSGGSGQGLIEHGLRASAHAAHTLAGTPLHSQAVPPTPPHSKHPHYGHPPPRLPPPPNIPPPATIGHTLDPLGDTSTHRLPPWGPSIIASRSLVSLKYYFKYTVPLAYFCI